MPQPYEKTAFVESIELLIATAENMLLHHGGSMSAHDRVNRDACIRLAKLNLANFQAHEEEPPIAVVFMEGGAIHDQVTNRKMRVILMDADVEESEDEESIRIYDGTKYNPIEMPEEISPSEIKCVLDALK